MTAPDLTEPILGFRAWQVDDVNNLRSVYIGSESSITTAPTPRARSLAGLWRPGVNTACCYFPFERHPRREAPHPRCPACGLYAYHDLDRAIGCWPIVGLIRAWGAVQIHGDGFRAQHAEVVALLRFSPPVSGLPGRRIRAVGERYGVPVVSKRRLVLMAERGRVPVSLRP